MSSSRAAVEGDVEVGERLGPGAAVAHAPGVGQPDQVLDSPVVQIGGRAGDGLVGVGQGESGVGGGVAVPGPGRVRVEAVGTLGGVVGEFGEGQQPVRGWALLDGALQGAGGAGGVAVEEVFATEEGGRRAAEGVGAFEPVADGDQHRGFAGLEAGAAGQGQPGERHDRPQARRPG
jgi:hypothetical protein